MLEVECGGFVVGTPSSPVGMEVVDSVVTMVGISVGLKVGPVVAGAVVGIAVGIAVRALVGLVVPVEWMAQVWCLPAAIALTRPKVPGTVVWP